MLRPPLHTQIVLSRSFRCSAVFQKQPAHDRQRRRRKMPPPFHSIPFYDQDPFRNLAINQLFPVQIPGSWGSTDDGTKEKFFKIGQVLNKQPTLHEKLNELYFHENNLWYHRLSLPLDSTDTLDFCQYITRTNLYPLEKLKPIYKNPEYNNKFIRNRVQECLKSCSIQSDSPPGEREEYLGSLMECLYGSFVELCKGSHIQTQSVQLSVGAKIETFFKRSGFANLYDVEKIKNECLSDGIWESTEETILDAEKLLRFVICGKLAWTLRSDSPLPPFVAGSDTICFEDCLPQDGCLYRPEVFGLDPVDHYNFSCTPFVNNARSPEYIRSIPGFWPSSPFVPQPLKDDPCQFGLVGVLDVTPSPQQIDINSTMDSLVSMESMSRDALSNAVLTAFAWTSAMAYNAGFTLYNELDRPFSTQLLLFDAVSATWQLIAYQLNTLSGLWKADDAGDPFNLLWYSPRISFFDEEQAPNPKAMELLALAMLLPPKPPESKPESIKTRLIPDSLDENKENGAPGYFSGSSGGVELTELEREALRISEGEELARRNLPIRVTTYPLPHPNEIFFLKMTRKEDLLAEMQGKMPAFGGPKNPDCEGCELPVNAREMLRKHRLDMRARTAQSKVQKRPPRWR